MPGHEFIHLHSTVGGSDKEYTCSLDEAPGGWNVNISYGRRGSTLRPLCKTNKGPVSFEAAKKVYDKIVNGQISEGYRVIDGGQSYVAAPSDKKRSDFVCQLSTAIEEDDAEGLNGDDRWVAQEKWNGVRLSLERVNGEVRAINRKGFYIGFPVGMKAAAEALPGGDFLIDGEGMGDVLRAFDIVKLDGKDVSRLPLEVRYRHLASLLAEDPASGVQRPDGIRIVATAVGTEAKRALYARLQEQNREGIVYKRLGSPYEAGRNEDHLKRKFYETLSAVVQVQNDQRSVKLSLLQDGTWISVGSCTIPPNHAIPAAGAVVEVRYLYAHPGGSLVQPTYLGVRTDINAEECTTLQVKYKGEETTEVPVYFTP
jgi:bifunctional non-homologous end joining protein LigD